MALVKNVLRGAQIVFAIIVLGTAAYVAHFLDSLVDYYYGGDYNGVPGQVSFILFVASWTILAALFLLLAPIFASSLANPIVLCAVDGLTTVLWFAGAIAYAVFTGAATGAVSQWYQVLQASVAFSFFSWAAFMATLILSIMALLRGGHSEKVDHNNPELQHV